MTSKLESLKWDVNRLIPAKGRSTKRLTKVVDKLFAELAKINKYNFEAILPLQHMDMGQVEIHWSSLSYGEDYETSATINYDDPVTGSSDEMSLEDREAAIEKIDDAIAELEAKNLTGAAATAVEKKLAKLEELKSNIENADPEPAELMWNYSWQPDGRDVDGSIAERVPQITWVRKLSDSAENSHDRDGDLIPGAGAAEGNYLTLTCIGQDNGPALMAYVILAHGIVPQQYVQYWRELEWTQHVIGSTCLRECAIKLGVLPALNHQLKLNAAAKLKARKAHEKEEARKKAIRDTPMSEELIAFLKAELEKEEGVRWYETAKPLREYLMALTGLPWSDSISHPLYKEWNRHCDARDRFDWVSALFPKPEVVDA